MILQTEVHIDRSPWAITHEDRILTLGSCFSDNIARALTQRGFCVTANPFGTLYNPISIAHHMTDELVQDKDVILITFGTAWVYLDNLIAQRSYSPSDGLFAVVDNCQKRPATDFTRYRLTVEEILSAWQPILERYADKRFVFTVSPIRHKKDGLHANQLSKAILLQSIDLLIAKRSYSDSGPIAQRSYSAAVPEPLGRSYLPSYFPSYEIVLDELRDYRFYADDLVHPSQMAIEYIFERFAAAYLYQPDTRMAMDRLYRYYLDTQHRPLHPDTPEALAFAARLAQTRQELQTLYPWIQ